MFHLAVLIEIMILVFHKAAQVLIQHYSHLPLFIASQA